MEAGADGDGEGFVEDGAGFLGGVAVESEAESADAVGGGGWTVEVEFGVGEEEVDDGLDHGLFFGEGFGGVVGGDVFEGGAEAGDADGVGGAAFEEVGEEFGHGGGGGVAAGAAFAEGVEVVDGDGVVDVESAGAGGAEEGFVAGEGEEVDVGSVDVDGDGAEGLGDVDEEFDFPLAGFFDDAADVVDGLDGADDVGGVGDGDEFGFGRDGFFDVGGVDDAGGGGEVDAGEGDEFSVGHGLEGARDGVVFEGGGDDVIAGTEEAFECDVERVGGVHGENHAVVVFSANEVGELFADAVEHFFGTDGHAVSGAAGVGGFLGEELGHARGDGGGFGPRGGGVVEVNDIGHKMLQMIGVIKLKFAD